MYIYIYNATFLLFSPGVYLVKLFWHKFHTFLKARPFYKHRQNLFNCYDNV